MAKTKKTKTVKTRKTVSNNLSKKLFLLILSCFFISGLTGLIYEILWTRMIVKIIGGAPFAVSIVLTVFMGGLGLGSYLAGRSIDRIKDPLQLIRLYGLLELGIGAYGLIIPVLLIFFSPIYAFIYNHLFHYFLSYNLLTFAGCIILLIIPVTFMGATLPILSRFFITTISRVGTHVGRLYGLNTIGAAAGALLCGFWLIYQFGVWGTLVFAIILNVIIGVVCIAVSRRLKNRGKISESVSEVDTGSGEMDAPESMTSDESERKRFYALVIFCVSGFCAMAYEVIWAKLLGLIVGPTTYSFTIVLVTFITGLALGSIFFGRLGDRVKNVFMLLLFTQVAAALFALIFSQLMGNSQIFFAKLIYQFKDNFVLLSLVKASALFIFMFFPTFCLGATFPLVGKIYTRSLSQTGRSIGFAYAINSLGAVLGAFCGGFVLVPLVGKETGLAIVTGLQLITALLVCMIVFGKTKAIRRIVPVIIPALAGILLCFVYPTWDRQLLSLGKYHRFEEFGIELKGIGLVESLIRGAEVFKKSEVGELVFYGDGIGGFTTVMKYPDLLGKNNYVLINSGKPDASSGADMQTQTLSAHFPMLFHPDPKNVMVLGHASGITAGEALHYPLEKMDILEISEQVVEASKFFKPWNNNVLSDPRTNLIIQDGRAHLNLTREKYDVIISEPSNPWMAGLATLFTREFFSMAEDRLNDEGIFLQFIHTYQMDWPTFAMVGRTFYDVFPNSLLVFTNPSSLGPDFLLVGIKGSRGLDQNVAEKNLKFIQKSKNVSMLNSRIFYNLIVSEDLNRLFGEGPINTDYRPWLEFSAPKLMHTNDLSIGNSLMAKRWLSKKTISIISEDLKDIDKQIDFAAYALKIHRSDKPFQNPVDMSKANEDQKERYYDIIEGYCTENIVTDFSLFGDEELRQRCISRQINSITENFQKSENKASLYLHKGVLYAEEGAADKAIESFADTLRIEPDNAHAYYNLGLVLESQDRTAEAVDNYTKALSINPHYGDALNNLAWILATTGYPNLRDGARAIQLAEHACEINDNRDPFLLDTLAAAYAESGQFEKAYQTAQEAESLAVTIGHNDFVKDVEKRMQLYKSGRPFRKE